MTRQEMSEIFAIMLLAWPNAPMLRPENQRATICLWTACLPEVDSLIGKMAVIELCRTCHYPPSIAQMREAADKIRKEMEETIREPYYALALKAEHEGTPFCWKEIEASRRRELREEMSRTVKALKPPDNWREPHE